MNPHLLVARALVPHLSTRVILLEFVLARVEGGDGGTRYAPVACEYHVLHSTGAELITVQ